MVESNFPYLLLFGGSINMTCNSFTNDIYRLTFQGQNKIHVQQLTYRDIPLPPMFGSSLTYTGENIFYIAGGITNDGYNNDIWRVKLTESNKAECELVSSINNARHSGTTEQSYICNYEWRIKTNDSSLFTQEIVRYKVRHKSLERIIWRSYVDIMLLAKKFMALLEFSCFHKNF